MFKKWFTLVELIVVVTILAILATIWFVAYTSYMKWTRDVNRVAQLKAITDSLKLYKSKHTLPLPNDFVEVRGSWELIAYQWYLWKNILEKIEYSTEWIDPKDKTYFSYYLTKNRKYFQLMAFLEKQDLLDEWLTSWIFNKVNAEIKYKKRYPFVDWKSLWILIDENNVPIQEITKVVWSWYLDIENTNDKYISILRNDLKIIWTWAILKNLKLVAKLWGKIYKISSCKNILENWLWKKGEDGYYTLLLDSFYQVYCDMTIEWGWWTRYAAIKWNFDFNDTFNCIISGKVIDNDTLFCASPLKFNLNTTWEFLAKEEGKTKVYVLKLQPYKDTNSRYKSYNMSDYFDCTYDNIYQRQSCWLWLNWDSNNHADQQWWISSDNKYKNGYWAWASVTMWGEYVWDQWFDTAKKYYFFVR